MKSQINADNIDEMLLGQPPLDEGGRMKDDPRSAGHATPITHHSTAEIERGLSHAHSIDSPLDVAALVLEQNNGFLG